MAKKASSNAKRTDSGAKRSAKGPPPTASGKRSAASPAAAKQAGQLPRSKSTKTDKAIRERIASHPNAMIRDIIGSLELDGIDVTAEQVETIMNELRSPPA